MEDAELMTIAERRQCLRRMQRRYRGAIPAEKTRLLDEMVAMTTLHCKSLVRLLDPGRLDRRPRRRQWGRA